LLSEELIGKASETVLVIDEVHKALNDTKRTSIALELSRLSQDFVALTGTPVVDSNTYKLIWWFEQIVDFEVNEKNFWVAANGMIAKKVNTGVSVDDQEVLARMTDEESARYRKLVPVSLGGTNSKPSGPDIREAFELCFDVCDRTIISETVKFLEEDTPTMVVARNSVHQRRLQKMLIKKGLREKEIFLLEGKDSIFITDEAVAEGKVPDYKVIIVPKDKSEGYTATRMGAMVTGVYFSNNAVREQLRGRINRLCQRREEIYYRTVHIGILSYTLKRYNDAASLSAAMSALAKDVNVDFDF
jgi:superfamily II DNA or RNA helicase